MDTNVKARVKCAKGHSYFKTKNTPICPVCETQKIQKADFFEGVGIPAKRALESIGVNNAHKLSKFSEKEILSLHGMGPATIPLLVKKLEEEGLGFR